MEVKTEIYINPISELLVPSILVVVIVGILIVSYKVWRTTKGPRKLTYSDRIEKKIK